MDEPEVTRKAVDFLQLGSTLVRIAPRVPIKQSTSGAIFGSTISRRSNPAVEPMKYPWSKANITVFPLLGLKIFAKCFFIP